MVYVWIEIDSNILCKMVRIRLLIQILYKQKFMNLYFYEINILPEQ